MSRPDTRSLSREELQEKRRQVIELYQSNVAVMKIVEATGLTWPTVNSAIKKYEEGGVASLMPAQRGRKQGTGRKLSEEQERELRILFRKRPWQINDMKSVWNHRLYLWNRDAVGELIEHLYGISLSERSIAQYLTRWGFPSMPKRPMKRYPKEVRVWLDGHYDSLKERAMPENAAIFWLRRLSIRSDKATQKQSIITATSAKGKVHWLLFTGSYTKDCQESFLKAIGYEFKRRKLFLIRGSMRHYDNYKVHDVLRKSKGRIKLFPPIDPKWQNRVFNEG